MSSRATRRALLSGPRATPEMRDALRERMGLDQPIPIQLLHFFGSALTGDLGIDLFSRRPVTSIVLENLPYTLALIAAGLGWAVLIGIPLGCYSALYRNSLIDKLTGVISVGTISIPSFVVAIYTIVAVRRRAELVSGDRRRRSGRSRRSAVASGAAGLRRRPRLGRLSRPHRARLDARGHGRKPCPHGARLRPTGVAASSFTMRCGSPSCRPSLFSALAIGNLLSSAVFAETVFARPGIGKLIVDMVQTPQLPGRARRCAHHGDALCAGAASGRPHRRLARSPCPRNPLKSRRRPAIGLSRSLAAFSFAARQRAARDCSAFFWCSRSSSAG